MELYYGTKEIPYIPFKSYNFKAFDEILRGDFKRDVLVGKYFYNLTNFNCETLFEYSIKFKYIQYIEY